MSEHTFAAVVLFASTISLITSLHFAVISLVRIRAVCLFCSMLYLSSLALFAMALRLSANRSRFLTQLKTGASLLTRYFLPFTPITSAVGNLGRLRVLSLLSVTCLAVLVYIIPPAIENKILIPKVKQFMASDEAQAALKMWLAAPVKEISIIKEPIEDRDFSLGPENAPITLVEFSDFECPHCQLTAPRVHALLERYPTAVRVVFKHYPLDASCNRHLPRKLHEFACRAAAMNRCAGIQNPELFFPMADALFALGSDFSDESLGIAAKEVGVNLDQFASCVNSVSTMDRIKKDIEEAARIGLQGTPTFFANGRLVSGQAMEVLPIIIEHVLGEQKKQTN